MDFDEKLGQIAHLDHDPSNGTLDNLAFLCMKHHAVYDSKPSVHKNYVITEVKAARDCLYREVNNRSPLQRLAAEHGVDRQSARTSTPPNLSKGNRKNIAGISQHALADSLEISLNYLSEDRFTEDENEFRSGGWSQSYSRALHSLAFLGAPPEHVSPKDSITVTYWVVRGLHACQRLRGNVLDARVSSVALLEGARSYLHKHFHNGRAGLWHSKSQFDLSHIPDIRHNATFAKALLQYKGEDLKRIQSALEYVLTAALDSSCEHRVPTHVEVLSCIELLTLHRELRAGAVTTVALDRARQIHEERLLDTLRVISVSDQGKKNCALFFDPKAADHMAPYYTWWTLDAYGEVMKRSSDPAIRRALDSAVNGLLSLKRSMNGETAFPLISDGDNDIGATAQIAEVLYRLDSRGFGDLVGQSLRFVVSALPNATPRNFHLPYTIWALFALTEKLRHA